MNGLCSSCTQPVTCCHGVVVFSLTLSTSEPINFISFVTIYILVNEIVAIKLITCHIIVFFLCKHIIVCCANFLAQETICLLEDVSFGV